VVAGRGPGAILEEAPGRPVALLEVFGRPIRVGVVAQGEDRALDVNDEPGGCLVASPGAVGDVARRNDHRGGVFSGPHSAAIRIVTVVTMTTVTILLLAPTPPSTC